MIKLTVAQLADVLGVDAPESGGDALITEVVVDSRLVRAGAVFIAFDGEFVDGHDYVEQAWADGAVAAITTRPIAGGPCLVVADPLAALGSIGRHVVERAKPGGLRVIGITGSQGKTSTKDLLAQILESVTATVAPEGSKNNELGLPLTATGIDEATRFLISEMGARGIGHIRYLCDLTPPDVGVVVNVGTAHLGEFGSREAIAQAKGELVEALPSDGTAVLNADDPLVTAMRSRTEARVLTFGVEPTDADVAALDVVSDDLGRYGFLLRAGGVEARVQLGLVGRHQVPNAVAAGAAALAVGVELDVVARALTAAGLRSRWRMEIDERPDGVVIVNDAYNANPESMRAALQTLTELGVGRRRRFPGARTWAVLGAMAELGDRSAAEHLAIGAETQELRIDRVIAVGEDARGIAEGARDGASSTPEPGEQVWYVEEPAAAVTVLADRLQPGDVVLVKASRSVGLETLAEELLHPSTLRPGDDS